MIKWPFPAFENKVSAEKKDEEEWFKVKSERDSMWKWKEKEIRWIWSSIGWPKLFCILIAYLVWGQYGPFMQNIFTYEECSYLE